MKRVISILLCGLLIVSLSGCKQTDTPPETTKSQTVEITLPGTEDTGPANTIPETTIPETTESETTAPETTEPEVTEPEHSALYIPGQSIEDVIFYFNEVCLDSEFIDSGDPTKIQKWMNPICYTVYGSPTEEDLEVLDGFTAWLNTLQGFPGIQPADSPEQTNLRLHFTGEEEMVSLMGENAYGLDGMVTFWYDNDIIYDEIICIRTDIDQYVRNSVILEEIYNGLGPVQDTMFREDSIIYQMYSTPQSLTEVDELILKLLYDPTILCGMDAQECETVIRSLYY